MAEPPTAPCADCGDAGYVVEQVLGSTARARRCACQAACPRCGESGLRARPLRRHRRRAALLLPPPRRADRPLQPDRHPGGGREGLVRDVQVLVAGPRDARRPPRRTSPGSSAGTSRRRASCSTAAPAPGRRTCSSRRSATSRSRRASSCGTSSSCCCSPTSAPASRRTASHMEILRPLLSRAGARDRRARQGARHRVGALDARRAHQPPLQLRAHDALRDELLPRRRARRAERARAASSGPATAEFQRDAEAMTLPQRVGDRIYSRLNEMCAFVKLDPGHDLRKDRRAPGRPGSSRCGNRSGASWRSAAGEARRALATRDRAGAGAAARAASGSRARRRSRRYPQRRGEHRARRCAGRGERRPAPPAAPGAPRRARSPRPRRRRAPRPPRRSPGRRRWSAPCGAPASRARSRASSDEPGALAGDRDLGGDRAARLEPLEHARERRRREGEQRELPLRRDARDPLRGARRRARPSPPRRRTSSARGWRCPFSFANSTACAFSTFAPALGSSCISSYESVSSFRASGTTRGSAVKTPSTSRVDLAVGAERRRERDRRRVRAAAAERRHLLACSETPW